MKTILVSGGDGKFAGSLKSIKSKYRILTPNKKQLNILYQNSIDKYLSKNKVDYFIHAAAFSTPMINHKKEINRSISTNIIGSANVAVCCSKKNIKLIYISTNFVYPGRKGNYREIDDINPVNEYGWSKLGGECAMHIYKNTLILRICMNEDIFPHKAAYANYITSFLKKSDAAKITLKLLNKKGVINVGGRIQSAYNFAKSMNSKIKRIKMTKSTKKLLGTNTSINVNKLSKIKVL